jgi:hypothetical protein
LKSLKAKYQKAVVTGLSEREKNKEIFSFNGWIFGYGGPVLQFIKHQLKGYNRKIA